MEFQSIVYKWQSAGREKSPSKPQPLVYKRSNTARRPPPKPQPRGLDGLAAVLVAHFVRSCGPCVARLRPRGCPFESHPPHRNRTSRLPSLAAHGSRLRRSRSPRPSRGLLAPSGRSQAHATADLFISLVAAAVTRVRFRFQSQSLACRRRPPRSLRPPAVLPSALCPRRAPCRYRPRRTPSTPR